MEMVCRRCEKCDLESNFWSDQVSWEVFTTERNIQKMIDSWLKWFVVARKFGIGQAFQVHVYGILSKFKSRRTDRCCRVDHCDSLILVQNAWIVGMQRIGIGGTVLLAPLDFKRMIPPCVGSHLLADGFEPWCYACFEAGNGRWQVPDIRPWQWCRTEEQSMTLTGKVLECFSFHICNHKKVIQTDSFENSGPAGVKPPGKHLKDLVIYETHVRGMTRILDQSSSQSCLLDAWCTSFWDIFTWKTLLQY